MNKYKVTYTNKIIAAGGWEVENVEADSFRAHNGQATFTIEKYNDSGVWQESEDFLYVTDVARIEKV